MSNATPLRAARRQPVLTDTDVELFRSLCDEPDGNALCFLPDDPGCIRWTGRIRKGGWGYFYDTPAHHIAWFLTFGDVPGDPGLEVDHLCQVRDCVSVAHLEWVTTLENQRRIDLRRSVCRRGHDWTGSVPFFRHGRQARVCFQCVQEGPAPRQRDRRRGFKTKAARMIRCPRGHDVTGDNGYDMPGLPGRRGCWTCTEAWRAALK